MNRTGLLGFAGSRAEISECGLYRYGLWRKWSDGPQVLFVMLNPSTADANQDDPTIRRCISFAKSWEFGSLAVGNLFAYRSTDPGFLKTVADPVGPMNDYWLLRIRSESSLCVAAWGNHGNIGNRSRFARDLLTRNGQIHALRMTRQGEPEHPLYIPRNLRPVLLEATS